jgi:cytochrome P450 family 142 subfamily A polypeptide 1
MDVRVPYLQPESWDSAMPERLRWLRENEPVYWSEPDNLWVLTKYADVEYVSKRQEVFTSALGVRPGTPAKIGLIDEGEPRHSQLRRLINRGFTPRMVAKLEETFLSITTDSIDSVAQAGECDFVTSIAVPLPLMLIAEMMGIGRADYPRFHKWSDDMIQADGSKDPAVMAKAGMAFMEYATYLRRIIDDRRANPIDDLVSILTGAKDQGLLGTFAGKDHPAGTREEHLSLANDELVMMLVILLVAGNETTRNAISGGMQLLIEHPDERRKLLEDPSLVPSAVEEMVRLVSPVHSFSRTATRDTELRGRTIRAGEQVLLLYPSANRDAEVYDQPDAFRVERNPQHLGFGVGSHFCLGANLARMEMRVAFEHILRRLPDMEYAAGGPVVVPSALVRSCVEMKVRFTPERRAA